MPTLLEEQLRAVQHSIAEVKKRMVESVNVEQYEKLEELLIEYYEEEQNLLKEIERNGGE